MKPDADNLSWPQRLHALDTTRGLAALAVVLWHWQHFAYAGISRPSDFDRSIQPLYGVLKIFYERGEVGVDYFFILSGFIFFWLYRTSIADTSTSFRSFWVQRFSRLYPLHFVTLLLVLVLQSVYAQKNGTYFIYPRNDAYHFVLHLGFASHWGLQRGHSFNSPVWSVSIEILLYFVFFVLARYRGTGPKAALAISLAAACCYQFLYPHYIFRGLAMYFLGGTLLHFVAAVSRLKTTRIRTLVYALFLGSWALVLADFYIADMSGPLVATLGTIGKLALYGFTYYLLLPATICAVALLEIDRRHLLTRFSWIGDITYSSYLLHFPLQMLVALSVSYGLVARDFFLRPVSLLAFFAVLISISLLTFSYFEKPCQRRIRALLQPSGKNG